MGRRRSQKWGPGTFLGAVLLAGLLSVDHHLAQGASDAGAATCVKVTTASPYVPYGYNHVVTLTSTCPRDATCSVATDVAPAAQTVTVPKGGAVDVLTFMASPSQTFSPRVACTLR